MARRGIDNNGSWTLIIMVWLVIRVVALWPAVRPAGFRRFPAIAAVVLTAGALATLGCVRAEEKEPFSDTERVSEEKSPDEAISTQQVEFRNLRMGVGGPSVELNGRVSNNNPTHTLTQVVMRLRVLECDASYRCDTLEEQTESISVSVPPQQTREMSHDVFFNALGAARLNRTWNHELLSVSGSLIPPRTP